MSLRRRRFAVRTAGYGLLLLGTILYVGPFAIQVATSFKTDADAALHPLSLIASPLTFAAWNRAFGGDPTLPVPLGRWVGNSVLVAVTVTVGRLIIDSMAGYALARLRFVGRRMIFGGILAVMAVPGVVLLIPTFLVLKQLSMFDSYSGMVIPLLSDAVGIMLMKSAFEQIPSELEDAARIDGAGPYRTFASVMLPLVRPALVTVAIISFQGSWNQFTHFLVATSDPPVPDPHPGHRPAHRRGPPGPAAIPVEARPRHPLHDPDSVGLRDLPALFRPLPTLLRHQVAPRATCRTGGPR